jgi:hypothetical protein
MLLEVVDDFMSSIRPHIGRISIKIYSHGAIHWIAFVGMGASSTFS